MNISMIASILGGVGLFILGMVLMTDHLTTLAGNSLRKVLSRFVSGRFTSVISGACVTTAVQSSHATTIATIGFVSAGLITFQQSIGVILGADLGTTSTGWIVALLGFKFNIGLFSLPLICAGALMRLLGKEKTANAGLVLAGFGLIFVGIDTLQGGMSEISARFNLAQYSDNTLSGRFILVLIGIGMTVIMQASSAAVAATIIALHAATITLDQAVALIIGQNIGTSITAAVAAIGASVPARRTAAAHIMIKLITGVTVFIILPGFVSAVVWLMSLAGTADGTITLAAFHTAFNVFGVLMFLPFVPQFSKLLIRMIPDRGSSLTGNLDSSMSEVPSIALEAARLSLMKITRAMVIIVKDMMDSGKTLNGVRHKLTLAGNAVEEVRFFLSNISSKPGTSSDEHSRHVSLIHVINHIDDLIETCGETEHLNIIHVDKDMQDLAENLSVKLVPVIEWLGEMKSEAQIADVGGLFLAVRAMRKKQRILIFEKTAAGELNPQAAQEQIEAIRWLDRVTYRIWRGVFHLGEHLSEK